MEARPELCCDTLQSRTDPLVGGVQMPDQVSQMRSLRDVASRINSGADLMTLLRDLAQAACDHGGWSMGSIMAVDVAHGYADVVARYDPTLLRKRLEDRWELATSPALVALRKGEPV